MRTAARPRRIFRGIAVAAGLAASVVIATPALAGDLDNLYSAEACKYPGSSQFTFHIFYNSGQNGAYRNIGYAVYNFNDAPDGVAGATTPLTFCANGAPGAGAKIKNNAASGENEHYKYKARLYSRSGFKGNQDVMDPYQHHDRFRNVYNDNASFQWTSR